MINTIIKEYVLEDGSEFKTITIPKGTALFHGLYVEEDTNKLFQSMTGISSTKLQDVQENGYLISPTMQTFFYPAPYVSLSVDYFNTHVLFLTSYNLELLLLIKPSLQSRDIRKNDNGIQLIKTCKNISENDVCGFKHVGDDPCFTDYCITNFKNIAGYIAIARNDKARFLSQYKYLYKKEYFHEILQILSTISTNSRDLIGIPEIVIHPLHSRRTECFRFGDDRISRSSYNMVNRIKLYLNQYNYLPLFYFTHAGVFHFNDLSDEKILYNIIEKNKEALNKEMNSLLYINDIFKEMNNVIEKLLSPSGYIINGIQYYLTVDMRTGFYKMLNKPSTNRSESNNKQLRNTMLHYYEYDINNNHEEKNYYIPTYYNLKDKYAIMSTIGRSSGFFVEQEIKLRNNGLSLKNIYILDKGNSSKYNNAFMVERMFPRLDIFKPPSIRRHHNTHTRRVRNKKNNKNTKKTEDT